LGTSEEYVHPKLHLFIHFLIAMALAFASLLSARAQTLPAAATATLHGRVSDPTGALIPGAKIEVDTFAGTLVTTATADAEGTYAIHGLTAGGYIIKVTYDGFAPFQSQTITLAPGQVKRIDVAMAIQAAQQNVVVTDESSMVNVEAGGNSNAVVLKDKDLDALSDDPDELANELSALAGPSAGPNGGQIYIDGFTGGQLPPKSAIREIRINQNPFSAEFDRLGYGRIEILTKPGTDKLHGRFFIQGNDQSFNTGNPFTKVIPPYHSIQFNGTVSGSLWKSASYFISAEQRNNQNASIYSVAQAPVFDATSNTYVLNPISGSLFNPHTRTNISPRLDFQLGQKNTLTVRYQFYRNTESGDISSTQLPTQASDTSSTEHTLQMSDSIIINDRTANETRFEYRRAWSTTTPVSTTPQVGVAGALTAGGSSSQSASDHRTHLELQSITTMSLGAHTLKFGTWLRDNREANSTNANFNGTFNFTSIADYVGALNELNGIPCPTGVSCTPTKLTYTTGNQSATANVFDAALFIQDDWKYNRDLTLSGGLRWESQNHISDHSDWGPRVAFAYALDGHKNKGQTKTVLRGGYGIFYDRFSVGDVLSATRYSGAPGSQKQTVISNPTCFNPNSLSNVDLSTCGTPTSVAGTLVQIAPSFHSPNTQQFGASIERQVTKTTSVTLTYLHSFGAHQLVTRDSNAYLPGTYVPGSSTLTGVRPNSSLGIINQFYPEAVFKQDQLIVNFNARLSQRLGIFGFYNLTAANSDGGAGSMVSNSYNISQDYGRASFASRNMIFMMANYTGPWGIIFNPFLIARSGRPFNIVTSTDLTGDNFFNSRPSYATSASDPANVVHTVYGDFDVNPQPGEKIVPANLGNGPASVAFNLRISRSFGIGPKIEGSAGGPPMGGGGHRGGHGPGGGFGPGGFGGGPRGMFNRPGSNHKYSLTFTAQALNLFNNANYGLPVGTIIPSPVYDSNGNLTEVGPGQFFNRSNSLAGGIFSSGSASRRIFAQAIFSF
jgi:hypothetical protein